MVRGRESATSMEIEAAFRVEHKIADTPPGPPPPPPPPRKKHMHPNHVRVFFFWCFLQVCVYGRLQLEWERLLTDNFSGCILFVVILTVPNFIFFKLFVYLCNCYHLCFFFFVSRLLAEVYFQILWSPCKWFLLNTLTRVHVNCNLHFATPFICSCVGLTADSLGRVCIPT